jgi:hypothetical protein
LGLTSATTVAPSRLDALRAGFLAIGLVAIAAGLFSTTAFITRLLASDGEITEVRYLYALRAIVVIGGVLLVWVGVRAARETLQKASLLVVGLGIAVAGLEIALRAVEWSRTPTRPLSTEAGVRASDRPGLIWENTPSYVLDGARLFNSRGMRDEERAYEPTSTKIVVVGDSIEGWVDLPPTELYPRRLEAMLNAVPNRTPTQALDFGVYGYSLHQKILTLKYRGLEWAPAHVIVGYCLNDPIPSSEFEAHFARRPEPLIELRSLTLVNDRVCAMMHGLGEDFYRDIHEPGSASWAGVVDDLRELAELAREHHFDVTVVIFPLLYDVSGSYPWADIHRRVTEVATGAGIRVIDLLGSFEHEGIPRVRVDTVHPNARGHEIAAQQLFKALTARTEPAPNP